MGLSELRADTQLVIERLSNLSSSEIDLKVELVDNILPLMVAIMEAVQDGVEAEVADLADAVDQMIDGTEVLHPETAAKFVGVLEVGQLMAKEIDTLIKGGKVDDVRKKKLTTLVHAYRQGAKIIGEIIAEITMVDDEGEEDPGMDATENFPGSTSPDAANDDGEDDDEDDLAGEAG